ncbi:MAG: hypothetical protein RLY20_2576 [Verrucomicrobiota bacterium]
MVIFATGVITGGLLVKNTSTANGNRPPKVVVRTNQPPVNVTPPQMMRMEFLLRARNELQLTPEQHDRVEKIIREGQDKSRKIWDGVAPELRKELQSVHEKIRSELTSDQRRKFEQLLKNQPRQPGNADNNTQPFQERLRERQRLGNGDLPLNPNNPQRPPRRDPFPPLNNPTSPPPQDSLPPTQ